MTRTILFLSSSYLAQTLPLSDDFQRNLKSWLAPGLSSQTSFQSREVSGPYASDCISASSSDISLTSFRVFSILASSTLSVR